MMIMPVLRAAILTLLFLSCLAHAQTRTVDLRGENNSFSISAGTSFSASAGKEGKPADVPGRKIPAVRPIISDLDELLRLVKGNHVSAAKLKSQTLVSAAITSMLGQLDPHSNYYDPSEYQELVDDQQGRYTGIGTTISSYSKNGVVETFVLASSKNTPAHRAGLRFGDRIVDVDGIPVTGLDSLDVRDRLRGPIGTTARVTIERADGTLLRNIPIRRETVSQNSVTNSLLLDGGVGYIALTEGFGYTTFAEFTSSFSSLKQGGMTSLILDLRGNGGGLMDEAIRIAEKFLPNGQMIVSERGRHPADDRVWRSTNLRPEKVPLVLLVDGVTASASEIIAGAMQDNDRAVIVGTRTFGKGLVQDLIPLSDGSMLTLTTERYYTPSGRSIQREYSDAGLYDYFRHTNKADLIDRSATAVRTRKGRIVYGGDGIEPDLLVKGFEFTSQRADLTDRLFFNVRSEKEEPMIDEFLKRFCEQQAAASAKCNDDLPFLRSQLMQFRSYKSGHEVSAEIAVLKADPQVEAALKTLSRRNQ